MKKIIICYCFSTVPIVARKRLIVTFDLQCLSRHSRLDTQNPVITYKTATSSRQSYRDLYGSGRTKQSGLNPPSVIAGSFNRHVSAVSIVYKAADDQKTSDFRGKRSPGRNRSQQIVVITSRIFRSCPLQNPRPLNYFRLISFPGYCS